MVKGKRLTESQEKAIVEAYRSGEFIEEICSKFDISKTTLNRLRKRKNCSAIDRKNRDVPEYNGELIGKVFGKLSVIDMRVKEGKWGRRWIAMCDCSCGKKNVERLPGVLLRNEVKSCGCARNEIRRFGESNPLFKGCGDINASRWSLYRIQASKRKLDFSISIQYGWKLYLDQKGKCALSGLEISFPKTSHGSATASLDRIDSSKGYIEGNVQWTHKDINLMKRNFDEVKFKQLCKSVTENSF